MRRWVPATVVQQFSKPTADLPDPSVPTIQSTPVDLQVGSLVSGARQQALLPPQSSNDHKRRSIRQQFGDNTRMATIALGGASGAEIANRSLQVNEMGDYKLLGESLDDAAGEAFDKAAKMLGLGYPGGPAIAKTALRGTPERFKFPRPMTDRPGLDFSFSGLKTYTLNTIEKLKAEQGHLSEQDTADIALAFEQAVVDTLFIKCRRAVEQTSVEALVMAGGVSANLELRKRLENNLDAQVIYAPMELCTDNGAMIAYAGAQRLLQGEQTELAINTRPRWPLTELAPAHSTTPP